MLPRQVLRGTTYSVARRCLQSEFGLRPCAEVRAAFTFALGVAVERFGMLIHTYTVMSTHYHMELTDPSGCLPEFMQLLNVLLAKAMNVALDRTGPFFHPGSYSRVQIDDPETFLRRAAYTICNPVEAAAVRTPEEWPNPISLPEQLARDDAITALRPEFFFRDDAQVGRRETSEEDHRPRPEGRTSLPGAVSFCLTKPPMFDDVSDEEYRRLLRRAVDQRLGQLHAEHTRARRSYQGVARVLAQDPSKRARGPALFGLNPRFACGDEEHREELAQDLVDFWTRYGAALRAYRDGDHDVVFPDGTYKMRVLFDVTCHY
jgi:putative transposase